MSTFNEEDEFLKHRYIFNRQISLSDSEVADLTYRIAQLEWEIMGLDIALSTGSDTLGDEPWQLLTLTQNEMAEEVEDLSND